MRFHSALVLGLSLFTTLATAEAPAGFGDVVDAEKRGLGHGAFAHARDVVAGALHEIAERASPAGKVAPKTSAKKTPTTKASVAQPTKAVQSASKSAPTSKAKPTSSNSKSAGSKTNPTGSKSASALGSSRTLNTVTTTGTKSAASATKSAAPKKSRVKCGAEGSSCTGTTCARARAVDSRLAVNRRAFTDPQGDPSRLAGRQGNVGLSNDAATKRDDWIPFDGTTKRSVTIEGLKGCTAVIAVSRKGMYAFHIWEERTGDDLSPAKYATTLSRIQTKLEGKRAELEGGELYLFLPLNPDSPDELLYESERYNKDRTESESDPNLNTDWTLRVPRSQKIRDAIEQGSGLTITSERTYLPPTTAQEEPVKNNAAASKALKSWMTGQYDPAASNTDSAYTIWTKVGQMGTQRWPKQ